MTAAASTFDFLQWMDADLQAAFHATVRRRIYSPGQVIYLQDEPGSEMYRLLSGSVRMVVNREDGKEIVFTLFEPGDCFGNSSLIDGGPRPQTAEAVTEVQLEVLGSVAFKELRARWRAFDDALLRLLAQQMRAASTYYADANLSPLAVRVASRIVDAVKSFGTPAADGLRLTVPLSQTELAAMVGASRQSVNKVLQRFQDDKLLRIEYGTLLILNLAGLKAYIAST